MSDKPMRFADKLLPNQLPYNFQFNGDDYALALYQTMCASSGIDDKYQGFDIVESDRFSQEEMGSNPVSMRFLQILLHMAGAKQLLEIGSFIGVSAMSFATILPEDGKVITIEKFSEFANLARQNFARNGFSEKIDLIEGDAYEVLESLQTGAPFDVIFIDGNKERYKDYFIMADRLLSPKGIILVDDCFFHGDALNETPECEKGQGAKDFLDYAATRDDYLRVALPVSNGIYLMTKA